MLSQSKSLKQASWSSQSASADTWNSMRSVTNRQVNKETYVHLGYDIIGHASDFLLLFWCKYICHLVIAQYYHDYIKNGSIYNVDKYTCRPSFVLCSELSAAKSPRVQKPSTFKWQTKPNTQTMKTVNCMLAAVYMLTKFDHIVLIIVHIVGPVQGHQHSMSNAKKKKKEEKNTI